NDGTDPVQYAAPAVPRFIDGTRDILLNNLAHPPTVLPPNPPPSLTHGVPLRRLGLAVSPFGNSSDPPTGPGPTGPYPPLVFPVFGTTPADRDTILAAVGLPDTFAAAFTGEPEPSLTTLTSVGFPAASHDLSHLQG